MMQKSRWLRESLQLKGSILVAALPRTLLCGGFSGLIVYLQTQHRIHLGIPALATLIPNIVLGLLLVFRTNTAYERFWEGRKLWGTLVNAIRNLARQIWAAVPEATVTDRQGKIATLHLLVAFAVATKLHLRQNPNRQELQPLLPPVRYSTLQTMQNPPLEIAFWIEDYLLCQRLNPYQLAAMQQLLGTMVDVLGGCERILKTPMPLAYAIHLQQLLLLYCLSLPFQMVDVVGWVTPVIVSLISFMVFGIEEIGIEIENPFGRDANDLPLDTICETIHHNINDLMRLAASQHATT